MTQGEAAALFGVTQPRVSDLMRGKINLFSLDTLIDMAATAGMSPTVKVSRPKTVQRKRIKRTTALESVTCCPCPCLRPRFTTTSAITIMRARRSTWTSASDWRNLWDRQRP